MSKGNEVAALSAEVAQLRARLDGQAAELAALRAVPGPSAASERRLSRRHLLTGLAGLGVAGAAGVAGASPAAAADGDPLLLGQDNAATSTTRVMTTIQDPAFAEPAFQLSSDAYATLGVGVSDTGDSNSGKAALWADSTQSSQVGAAGVRSSAADGFAVEGWNESTGFPTVAGINQGVGPGLGSASYGGGAQLYLAPEQDAPTGPPPSGELGYIRLDAAGDLWVCTASGTPGTWTRLLREDTAVGRLVPFTPFRALDTRAIGGRPAGSPSVPGQKKGPLKGGEIVTLDLTGVLPIPAGAHGVLGNLTVVAPSYSGYLVAGPADTVQVLNTSALNYTPGVIVANAFGTQVNAGGLAIKGSGTASNTYHLIVDITAYLT